MSFPSNLGMIALQAVEDAALLETFDPAALACRDDKIDTDVLGRLAEVSDEVSAGSAISWKVRGDARQNVLSTLIASGRLEAVLRRHPKGHAAPFTQFLSQALLGRPLNGRLPPDDLRETAIVAYEVAAASLAGAGSATGRTVQDDLAWLRSDASSQAERLRSRSVLPGRLIGRGRERAALERYIATGEAEAPYRLDGSKAAPAGAAPFLITGCGGAGKSALLADIIRRRRAARPWAPVVLLDFDRSSNCRGGPGEWYSELTRQLALGRPALAQRMKKLRAEARQRSATSGLSDRSIAGGALAGSIRSGLGRALQDQRAAGQTLLVVLDTFEEVLTRSDLSRVENSLFNEVLSWADELASIRTDQLAAFAEVRIIVSGRCRPDLGKALPEWFCAEMEIGALSTVAARNFLRFRDKDHRLNPSQVDRAVQVLGGHPLSLILFERFVRQQPNAIEEVLSQGDLSRMLSGEGAARSLYTRFLQRLHVESRGGRPIDPEKVRRIAHPGLVLREVTAQHLAEIIAPGCGLALAPGEAEDLFETLTDQVWLVEELKGRAPRTVRHRPDVRRLMLPMMNGVANASSDTDAKLADQVRAVRREAVTWFTARSRTARDEALIEAAYHRAFLDDVDDDAHDEPLWKAVWGLAPDDVPAMPPRAAALVRYHGRGAASLSREQTAALPEALRTEARVRQTKSSLAAGRFQEAATTAEGVQSFLIPMSGPVDASRGSMPPSIYVLARDEVLGVEVNAAFFAGQYRMAAGIGWRAIIGMAEAPLIEPLPIEEDITTHWIWHAALARMISPHEAPTDRRLEVMLHRLLLPKRLEAYHLESAGLVLAAAIYIAAAGRIRVPKTTGRLWSRLLLGQKRIYQPATARLFSLAALWSQTEIETFLDVDPNLLTMERQKSSRAFFFPRQPLPPRPIAPPLFGRSAQGQENGYQLLNSRLPELEPLVLAILGPALQKEPERLLEAMRRLTLQRPDGPRELDADYLRQRLGGRPASSSALIPVITAASAHGLLPALLTELNRSGALQNDLAQLGELVVTYSRLLGATAG